MECRGDGATPEKTSRSVSRVLELAHRRHSRGLGFVAKLTNAETELQRAAHPINFEDGLWRVRISIKRGRTLLRTCRSLQIW